MLATGLQQAMAHVERRPDTIVLLGFVPQEADAEHGYIVPGEESGPAVRQVNAFVEKPSLATARALIERGGLWNSFIFAASGAALLRAFEQRCPDIVAEMRQIVAADGDGLES